MNRSILIVICDFLVLAAMSLSTGTGESVPPAQGTQAPMQVVTKDMQIEQAHKELKKRIQIQSEKKSLEASLADLQKELAALKQEAAVKNSSLNETSRQLIQANQALQEKERAIQTAQTNLAQLSGKLAKTESSLQSAKGELEETRKVVAAKDSELKETQTKVASLGSELKQAAGKIRETELGLSYAKGKLSHAEKELTDTRGKAEISGKQLQEKTMELAKRNAELEAAWKDLRNRDANLAKAQKELEQTRQALAKTHQDLAVAKESLSKTRDQVKSREEDLAFTRRQLTKAEEQLRSDALSKYSQAAMELSFHVKNERLMNDFEIKESFYLPEVTIGGTVYLISSFRTITGLFKQFAGYTRVTQLDYLLNFPESGKEPMRIQGPLWSLNADPRVCLLSLRKPFGTPLPAMTYEELRKRGVQDLTLFKSSSFGKDTATLEGRCSISLKPEEPYLYIRNSLRDSSELSAQPGDFILSKQGAFVGVVVSVAEDGMGRKQEARCYILPAEISYKDAKPIPLNKPDNSRYYTDFVNALNPLQEKIRELDRRDSVRR